MITYWHIHHSHHVAKVLRPNSILDPCTRRVPGVYQACTWCVPGVHQACIQRELGVFRVCTRRVPGAGGRRLSDARWRWDAAAI